VLESTGLTITSQRNLDLRKGGLETGKRELGVRPIILMGKNLGKD